RALLAQCESPEARAALLMSAVSSDDGGASGNSSTTTAVFATNFHFLCACCVCACVCVCVCVCVRVRSTALAMACRSNRTKMIEFLLREESVLWQGPLLTKALLLALPRCSVDVLRALLERGALTDEPPGQSVGGYYPIPLAC